VNASRTVLDAATARFLEGGCALVVGTVSSGGEPYATRGWGLTVLSDGPATIRLLLASDDSAALHDLARGGRVAITAADVPTARSMQLKGRCRTVEPATDEDRARAHRYMDAFFADVTATDGVPRSIVQRVAPIDFSACTVVVEERYDQSPGPSAGAPMEAPWS
jgi:hypothetical protein